MTTRYKLVEQLHFLGLDFTNQEAVITIQHWKSTVSDNRVYVRCHDGKEVLRQLCTTGGQKAKIGESFAIARREFAEFMLSDDAAGDHVARRGGPHPQWCQATDCGTMIPYAAAQCAAGHAVHHTNAGTYSHGSNRRPALTVITGGKR